MMAGGSAHQHQHAIPGLIRWSASNVVENTQCRFDALAAPDTVVLRDEAQIETSHGQARLHAVDGASPDGAAGDDHWPLTGPARTNEKVGIGDPRWAIEISAQPMPQRDASLSYIDIVNPYVPVLGQRRDKARGLAFVPGLAVTETPEGERCAHRARGLFQVQRVSHPAGQGRLPCTVSR